MAATHGKEAVFKLDDAGSTLRDLSAYLDSSTFGIEIDLPEVTTFGNDFKVYISGLRDGTVSIEGPYDPQLSEWLNGIMGLTRDFEYYPAGEPVGPTKPKWSGTLVMSSYEEETGVDDAGRISAEFQMGSDPVRAIA